MGKPGVVIFIDWYRPAYKAGGPIKSVENIVNSLSHLFTFYIITSQYDVDGAVLSVQPNQWIEKEQYRIIYLDQGHQNRNYVVQLLDGISFETVYFNSLFSPNFSIKPLKYLSSYNKKMVLAPRGMLGKGALRIKPLKKMAFLTFAKQTKRYNKLLWHASSAQEAKEIKRHFGVEAKVEVALNLFEIPKLDNPNSKKESDSLNLFFYSRIAKKKNLHFALRCLKELDHLPNIHFKVIGPIEEQNYWDSCLEFAHTFQNIKVQHIPEVDFEGLQDATKNCHFFFFPTLHENFGHVIAEALSLKKPVILSDQTPWRNLEESGVGFDFSLDNKNSFVKTLETLYNINAQDYQSMSEKCIPFLKQFKQAYCSTEAYQSLLVAKNHSTSSR